MQNLTFHYLLENVCGIICLNAMSKLKKNVHLNDQEYILSLYAEITT